MARKLRVQCPGAIYHVMKRGDRLFGERGIPIDSPVGCEQLVFCEVKAGRPMLSAVAVSVKGEPGPGFFDLARQLGKLGEAKQAFWRSERDAAYAAWKRPLPK